MCASEIADAFNRTCRDRRSDVAIAWLAESRGITFSDIHDEYLQMLASFRRLGIRAGDCIVSAVGNHPAFFPLLAAAMETGAALLPLGEATEAETLAILDKSGAAAIVRIDTIDRGVSVVRVRDQPPADQYGRSVVIKLTSGSTDLPKATLAGERAVIADARSITSGMTIRPNDINLAVIPLSHAYAIGNIVVPLILQGTRAALRPTFNPAQFADDARVSGATVFAGVPFMFDRLRGSIDETPLPSSLRLLITPGARIDPETVRWFHARGRKLHSFYGASETGGITYDETDALPELLHVGRPLPGVTIDMVPESAVSEGGRVFVKSGGMANGYATTSASDEAAAFQNGGFLTGDVGHLNGDGQLVLTGRVSPLVNVAGRKVDPAEIERVLTNLPDVADARVVGIDCATRGQELVAFVRPPSPSLTPLSLRRSCARTLSPYKIPRRFIFLEQWPVDARGKVDKRALQALATGATEDSGS